jgi:hypothetical protein
MVPIGEVCVEGEQRVPAPDEKFQYIDMSCQPFFVFQGPMVRIET